MSQRIDALLGQLSFEEKASLLAGANIWSTVPIPRLGIPSIKMTDGPVGARGAGGSTGPTSACFPCGTAIAATWDVDLVRRIGEALAEETRAKGAHVLLAPTVNIQRSPLAGRNFECFSEDPCLTAEMAAAYIQGLQSKGVGACIKHFICNDSEFERKSISSQVDERTLREIYLAPFEIALSKSQPWAVMSAYNRLNQVYCSENHRLLDEILKGELGFDGVVISDWFGTYSAAVIQAGLDLEMPGPGRWQSQEQVLKMLREDLVSPALIDDKVRRLLLLMERTGAFNLTSIQEEQSIDRVEDRQLIRLAAAEATVLLKNEHSLLPLDPRLIHSIAIIGYHASSPQAMGGGSAEVSPHYVISPLEAIRRAAGSDIRVEYCSGVAINRQPLLLNTGCLKNMDDRQGFDVTFFDQPDMHGPPLKSWFSSRSQITWSDEILLGLNSHCFSTRLQASFTPVIDGKHVFSLSGNGRYRMFLDDILIVDAWSRLSSEIEPWKSAVCQADANLTAGQAYLLRVEYGWEGENPWRTLRIGCQPPQSADPIQAAVELAESTDIALVFAGLSPEWESEGFDRVNMDLPGEQNELIEQVARANPNTVVVLNAGSPLRMPWLEQVSAVLDMWYPGQEAGNAIADVLFGLVDPGGRLPVTFPIRLEDNPAYINYPGENGHVYYGEGLFVGYRYYDKKDIQPLFPFGYGLSYTTFEYNQLEVEKATILPGEKLFARLTVRNIGKCAGSEVVQLYLHDLDCRLTRPEKELKAFRKIHLMPGESRVVEFDLEQQALAYYDDSQGGWVLEPGEFELLVGSSSRQIHLSKCFELLAGNNHTFEIKPDIRLNLDSPIHDLLADPAALQVLRSHLGALLDRPEVSLALDLSLREVAQFIPDILSEDVLASIEADLGKK